MADCCNKQTEVFQAILQFFFNFTLAVKLIIQNVAIINP